MQSDVPLSMASAAAAALDNHDDSGLNARMGSRLWVEFTHEDPGTVLRAMADYLDNCADTPAVIDLDLSEPTQAKSDDSTQYDKLVWTGTLYVDVTED
ncbi:hypothetical protein [Streptomyces sp. NPDC002851]